MIMNPHGVNELFFESLSTKREKYNRKIKIYTKDYSYFPKFGEGSTLELIAGWNYDPWKNMFGKVTKLSEIGQEHNNYNTFILTKSL